MLIDQQPSCRTLVLTGDGSEPLLHGQATCEARNLTDQLARMGALCNPKGRMLSQFLLHRQGEQWLLTVHQSLYEATLARLKKYGVFYKVDFTEFSGKHTDVWTEQDDTLIAGKQFQVVNYGNAKAIQIDQIGKLWRIFHHQPLSVSGSNTSLNGAWAQAGVALLEASETETLIPQALGLEQIDGVDFKKGCYTGQEIIARVHYKGKVKHKLARFSSKQAVLTDSEITDDTGKVVGKVFRCSPLQDKHWVLGLIAETDASRFYCAETELEPTTKLFN